MSSLDMWLELEADRETRKFAVSLTEVLIRNMERERKKIERAFSNMAIGDEL